ncbi:hypothetical protein ACN42_g393 [Penicillium freii]|uniref:Uncharacterized protein n=1 Tax=Penicillium freii TaxID=48697 RepID=A0A117NSQ8_PENFR|nr:hypothetical protein ACN42_g393 [Penicillium freii]
MSLVSEQVINEALGCQCHGEIRSMVDRENSRGGRSWLRLPRYVSIIAFKLEGNTFWSRQLYTCNFLTISSHKIIGICFIHLSVHREYIYTGV